jgi:hypothetical protein
MKTDIFEKILKDLLSYYLAIDDVSVEKHLDEINIAIKERVDTIDDLQVIIFPNDHNPPHFHVKSKSLKINAKFKIENCELINGEIGSKDLKKIKAFYLSPKGKITLETIWKRYNPIG